MANIASRVLCCASLVACGTGDNRVDPGDLELRDLLGIAPDVARTWSAPQRASARRVLDDELHKSDVSILATPPDPRATFEMTFAGWQTMPELPARGSDLLPVLAAAEGHRNGPLVISAAPRLAVIASYVAGDRPRLLVNPVLLAALEPAPTTETRSSSSSPSAPPPIAVADNGAGNPYSFYGSVAECAAAQRTRCEGCLASGTCAPITSTADGNAECTALGTNGGRGYYLICIDLALAIDSVSQCTANRAPSCPIDAHASESLATLESNAAFLDDASCNAPLDACLAQIYGSPNGDFPGPGSGSGTSPPRNTSIDCGDSCSGDSNCDASPNCETDGPSCDGSQGSDDACASSNDQSSCDDSSGSGGCSDGEDACGSENTASCDNGDCGGDSGGGGDCGGGGGGDCSGGGGGDCGGGGGGDCGGDGGGGGDCNAGAKRGHKRGGHVSTSLAWAFLPVLFAMHVRRRARCRRAAKAEES